MDQITEEKAIKEHFHNHALKGDLEEIGAIPLTHDQAENNPHNEKSQRKKNERYAELLHTITQVQEAFDALMDRLNSELNSLQTVIEELEKEMEQNREDWDNQVEVLNDIDDVFCNFEDGGRLDQEKAKAIFDNASIEVPDGTTDAQMIMLMQGLREQTIKKVDDLDEAFLIMEQDHTKLRAREDQVLAAKAKLEAIGNDSSLSNEAKLTAIHALDKEIGTKTLHRTATVAQNEELAAKADVVVDQSMNTDLDDRSANATAAIQSLDF